jgi:hypothetical protein
MENGPAYPEGVLFFIPGFHLEVGDDPWTKSRVCVGFGGAAQRGSPANARTKGFFESTENVPHDPCFFCRSAVSVQYKNWTAKGQESLSREMEAAKTHGKELNPLCGKCGGVPVFLAGTEGCVLGLTDEVRPKKGCGEE